MKIQKTTTEKQSSDRLSRSRIVEPNRSVDFVAPSPRMLRAARALVGLDQTQLAEEVGLTRLTVSRIENDDHGTSDPRRLRVIETVVDHFAHKYRIEFLYGSRVSGEGVRFRDPPTPGADSMVAS